MLDREEFAPVKTALNMVDIIGRIYPDEFQWRGGNRPFFDRLMGTDEVRKQLSSGESVDNIMNSWADKRLRFLEIRNAHLLY